MTHKNQTPQHSNALVNDDQGPPERVHTESIRQLLSQHKSYILGHRGARGEVFENSLIGFKHLDQLSQKFKNELVGVEFDVQLTSDGQLAVLHDDNLLRLFKSQSRVENISFKHLQHLTSGAYQVATLQQLAPLLERYHHIELEVKIHHRTNYAKLIIALNEALGQGVLASLPITLTSFDIKLHELMRVHPFLNTFKRGLLVELHTSVLKNIAIQSDSELSTDMTDYRSFSLDTLTSTNQPLSQTPNIAVRLGCQSIGLFYAFYSPAIMQLSRQHGLSTTAWTVNDANEAKRLIKLGVRYIITDYPTQLLLA